MSSPANQDGNGKIAIVGMGCRFPGGASSPGELWRLLAEGRDAVGERPPGRRELWGDDDEAGQPHSPAANFGGFLPDVTGFDAEFFGVPAREADLIDPQHRLLLEVAWEALDDAGLPPDRLGGTATGVFVGLSYAEYMERLGRQAEGLEGSVLANGSCVAGGRISYLLGLHGPCLVLDTACSSSLVALHLACQSLRNGECDTALAGGVSLMLSQRVTRSFDRMGMLSESGRCRAFDADADGFVRGEGCGLVVLRRLADAVAGGDRILAVIRGSAVNQDGRSDGLAAPSPEAQRALLRLALDRSGTAPGEVGMIEAHGTGTPVGDPVEFGSLAAVYGESPEACALTSVKTNLGHLETAAGASGLIKAVLCLMRAEIPANLHFNGWNPRLSAAGTRFFVPTEMTSWPGAGRQRVAAVSSFGFSGTNAHVLLEEAPPGQPAAADRPQVADEPLAFLVPAGSAAALPEAATRLADWLTGDGAAVPLADVAYTSSRRRSLGCGRLGVVAGSRAELAAGLRAFAAGEVRPNVTSGEVGAGIVRQPVWVFSGQGSQWPAMGRDLLDGEPDFAAALAEADKLIRSESGFSVLEVIRSGQPVTGCGRVQPALFAMQYALAALWRAHGVEPAGVVGHSMGEVAAAVVAGALTLADGVKVICRRSALVERRAKAGAMATVAMDGPAAEAELIKAGVDGTVSVAVLASPGSTVVAGVPADVERLVAGWEHRGIPARLIEVDYASHSPQMEPLLADLAEALAGLRPMPPTIPFYSTVTGPGEVPTFDAAYWCANLRRPVQFTAGITAAIAARRSVYVEVSPHPVVTRAVSDNLAGRVTDPVVLPTLRREENGRAVFRTQLAAAHCAGVAVDWSALYPGGQLAALPPITFGRRRHWIDATSPTPGSRRGPQAPLPGEHTEVPGDLVRHSWRGDAGTGAIPWLADHRVHGRAVLPGAAYAALAVSTACDVFGAEPAAVEVASVRLQELCWLQEQTEVKTTLTRTGEDSGEWEAYGRDEDGGWTRLARAAVRRVTAPAAPPVTEITDPDSLGPDSSGPDSFGPPTALYEGMRARGIEHGPAFQAVTGLAVSADGRTVWSEVELPAGAAGPGGLRLHPVLLDACGQTLVTALVQGPDGGLILPTGIGRITMPGDPAAGTRVRARITEVRPDGITGDVCLLAPSGQVVLRLEGMELTRSAGNAATDRWFIEPAWPEARVRPGPAATPLSTWLVCVDPAAVSADRTGALSLVSALEAAGGTVEVVPLPAAEGPLEEVAVDLAADFAARPAPQAVVVLPAAVSGTGVSSTGVSGTGDSSIRRPLTESRRLLAVAQAISEVWDEPPRLYAVTVGSQSVLSSDQVSLAGGGVRGLIRVLACEWPDLRATQVDVAPGESDGPDGSDGSRALAAELLSGHPDEEVALRGDSRYVARLGYAPLPGGERDKAVTRPVRYGRDGFRLQAGRLGEIGSLELATVPRRAPAAGEIEIRVQAAGVNFRDVLTVMGLLGTDDGARSRIGFECAGVVTAAGPGVTHLRPGDRVLSFDPAGGSFGSFITLSANAVATVPSQLSATEAAGLPAAFLTAWFALQHVARLQPGERVLIHSATGGTGLAAVAVARLLGAEVLGTAGNAPKRRYLRQQGVKHVFDSRSLDFAQQVREATGGEGVDVVLNSLAGPAIRAGLEALRPFGRFVELGVRDIMADAPLGLLALRHNITLTTVDLIELRRRKPEFFASLLTEVLGLVSSRRLAPLPGPVFALSDTGKAFTQMAGAKHIGKIVLTVPEEGETIAVSPDANPARPDGAYIITGGLTGVGLATARWLALGGAAQVIVNGRSAPSPAAEATLDEMRAAGCRVTVVRGDIAAPGTANELIAAVTGDEVRLRGIVHSAMVLDDAAMPNITEDQLRRVWTPKVTGAWRLHQATAGRQPDWFVVYSSMASLLGNPGQGAYAAANSWLDGFAAWRSEQGWPTLAVNWGPWGQTGAATDFADRGYQVIPTADGLRALGQLLASGRRRTGVMPGRPDTWIPPLARSSPFFGDLTGTDGSGTGASAGADSANAGPDDIRARLAAAEPGLARRQVLEAYLADQVRTVLGLGSRTLAPDTPLRSLGFDSLLSIELGSRLESGLGIRKLGKKFVWDNPTLAALADGLTERLNIGDEVPAKLTR